MAARSPAGPGSTDEASSPEDVTFGRLVRDGLLRNVAPVYQQLAPRIPAASARERAVLGYLSANCGACHNTERAPRPDVVAKTGITNTASRHRRRGPARA